MDVHFQYKDSTTYAMNIYLIPTVYSNIKTSYVCIQYSIQLVNGIPPRRR